MNFLDKYGIYLRKCHPRIHPAGIDWSVKYDGILVSEENPPEGVFFDASLYRGGIPNISPYPTGESQNLDYWRVRLPCKPTLRNNHILYKVTKVETSASRAVLLAVAPRQNEWFRLAYEEGKIECLDVRNNEYMWCDDVQWYCPKYKNKGDIWIKLFLPWDVPIRTDSIWDTVTKTFGA